MEIAGSEWISYANKQLESADHWVSIVMVPASHANSLALTQIVRLPRIEKRPESATTTPASGPFCISILTNSVSCSSPALADFASLCQAVSLAPAVLDRTRRARGQHKRRELNLLGFSGVLPHPSPKVSGRSYGKLKVSLQATRHFKLALLPTPRACARGFCLLSRRSRRLGLRITRMIHALSSKPRKFRAGGTHRHELHQLPSMQFVRIRLIRVVEFFGPPRI